MTLIKLIWAGLRLSRACLIKSPVSVDTDKYEQSAWGEAYPGGTIEYSLFSFIRAQYSIKKTAFRYTKSLWLDLIFDIVRDAPYLAQKEALDRLISGVPEKNLPPLFKLELGAYLFPTPASGIEIVR